MKSCRGESRSRSRFPNWVWPYHKKAPDEINVPRILHIAGKVDLLLDNLFEMGLNALRSIDPNCYEIRESGRLHGHRAVLIGNVNLNTPGQGGSEAVERKTKELIRDLGPGKGWCISAGNSVPDYGKPEKFIRMAETIRKWGAYPIEVD